MNRAAAAASALLIKVPCGIGKKKRLVAAASQKGRNCFSPVVEPFSFSLKVRYFRHFSKFTIINFPVIDTR